MRRGEITPELIELSKRAKELGFPQGVEEGDWYLTNLFTDMKDKGSNFEQNLNLMLAVTKGKLLGKHEYLILTFSRCLEWLKEKEWLIRTDVGKDHDCTIFMQSPYVQFFKAKTHHEAIAKAVVKTLEENHHEKR